MLKGSTWFKFPQRFLRRRGIALPRFLSSGFNSDDGGLGCMPPGTLEEPLRDLENPVELSGRLSKVAIRAPELRVLIREMSRF